MQMSSKLQEQHCPCSTFFKVEIKHDGDHVITFRRGDIIGIMQGTKRRLFFKSVRKQGELEFSNIEHTGL